MAFFFLFLDADGSQSRKEADRRLQFKSLGKEDTIRCYHSVSSFSYKEKFLGFSAAS